MSDDPINPKHYSGTACAEIGERLSANSYQVLKYNWRLGKKDDPLVEVGKSIWYLEREIELAKFGNVTLPRFVPDLEFFEQRLIGVGPYVAQVAWKLFGWNAYSEVGKLHELRNILRERQLELERGR